MSLIEIINSNSSKKIELYVDGKKMFSGFAFDIYRNFVIKNNLLWDEIKELECTCDIGDDVVKLYVKTIARVLLSRHLYGGKSIFSKETYPYELETKTCSHASSCSLFQKGLCISLKRLSSGNCKYVAKGVEKGGYKSKKGQEICKKYYELKDENPNLLDYDGYFFAVGDEYAFKLVYSYIILLPNGEYKVIDSHSSYNTSEDVTYISRAINDWAFIPKSSVTKEFMEELLNFKPYTILNYRVIEEYQNKIIPRIKIDIMKNAPELAEKIGLKNVDYTGKLAVIKTLKPEIIIETNVPDIRNHGKRYSVYWDGETVTVLEPKNLFSTNNLFGDFKEGTVKFIPNDNLLGTIEDNSWVMPDTIIKNY